MKRTFKFAFMALLAGLMVMPLISCEDDEDDDIKDEGGKKEHKDNNQNSDPQDGTLAGLWRCDGVVGSDPALSMIGGWFINFYGKNQFDNYQYPKGCTPEQANAFYQQTFDPEDPSGTYVADGDRVIINYTEAMYVTAGTFNEAQQTYEYEYEVSEPQQDFYHYEFKDGKLHWSQTLQDIKDGQASTIAAFQEAVDNTSGKERVAFQEELAKTKKLYEEAISNYNKYLLDNSISSEVAEKIKGRWFVKAK